MAEATINAQKAILATCSKKQPTLCNHLVQKYIEFTNLLAKGPVHPKFPVSITVFKSHNFDMQAVNSQCTYKSIQISSTTQNHILMANLRLLSDISIKMCNKDTIECTHCILETYSKISHFEIKSRCLEYFGQLFKKTKRLAASLHPMWSTILSGLSTMESDFVFTDQEINKSKSSYFLQMVGQVFQNSRSFKTLPCDHQHRAIKICIEILHAHRDLKVPIFDEVAGHICEMIKNITHDMDGNTRSEIHRFVVCTRSDCTDFTTNIKLLTPVVIHEVKSGSNGSWDVVHEQFKEILKIQNQPVEKIIIQLKCLHAILQTVRLIEHNVTTNLQHEFCNENEINSQNHSNLSAVLSNHMNTFPSARLLPNISRIAKYLVETFSVLQKDNKTPFTTSKELMRIIDIAICLLSVHDAHDMNEAIQLQLIVIAMCPFIDTSILLQNHFKKIFPGGCSQRMTRILGVIDGDWKTNTVQRWAELSFQHFSRSNVEQFISIVNEISERENSRYLSKLLPVLMGCVAEAKIYTISEYAKFFNKIAKKPMCEAVIANDLKFIYCLSSGLSYLSRTYKNNTYQLRLFCDLCCSRGNTNKAELIKNQAASGKLFINAFTKKYEIEDEQIQMNYFRLFKSKDSKTRKAMTAILPGIMNHLDVSHYMGLVGNAVDCWLSPIVDDEIDIQQTMIDYMEFITKCADELVLNECIKKLKICSKNGLNSNIQLNQSIALQLIVSFAASDHINGYLFLDAFLLIIEFCMSAKSMIASNAISYINDLCTKFEFTPRQLLAWYKLRMFKQIVEICVSNYLEHNVRLESSLQKVSACHIFKQKCLERV